MKHQTITQILDAKSVGKSEFEIAVCKDDLSQDDALGFKKEVDQWCYANQFYSKHLTPTSPIMVEGEEHPNYHLNVSLIQFSKTQPNN